MWLRSRRKRGHEEEAEQAKKAVADAHANLREVKSRAPEVTQITTALREFRERNHIAEQLQAIMEGGAN